MVVCIDEREIVDGREIVDRVDRVVIARGRGLDRLVEG